MKGEDIASESVAENDANVLSLTEKQVLQLGLAAWNIEKSFGYPLDIEWAFENVTKILSFLKKKKRKSSSQFIFRMIYLYYKHVL